MQTKSLKDIAVGQEIPPLTLTLTTSRIIAGALATGDFEPIHHDRSVAQRYGRKDIFMNILMTNGLMQRCVTDWAGPDVHVQKVRLRLVGGSVAGEVYSIRGRVASKDDDLVRIELEGGSDSGVAAKATVTIKVPKA